MFKNGPYIYLLEGITAQLIADVWNFVIIQIKVSKLKVLTDV